MLRGALGYFTRLQLPKCVASHTTIMVPILAGTIRTTTPTMLDSRTTVPQRLQNDYTSAPALLGEARLGRGPRGLQSPGLPSSSPDNTDMAAEKDQQRDAEAEGLSAA